MTHAPAKIHRAQGPMEQHPNSPGSWQPLSPWENTHTCQHQALGTALHLVMHVTPWPLGRWPLGQQRSVHSPCTTECRRPVRGRGTDQGGSTEPPVTGALQGTLPVVEREEEDGQGYSQLEPTPVWNGIGHPNEYHQPHREGHLVQDCYRSSVARAHELCD